jgi:hypothetical protein
MGSLKKRAIALVWLTSSEIWLIPLVDKIRGGAGGGPWSQCGKKNIKILNWKESLKNNSLHGFFFSLFWKNRNHMGYLFDICDDMCNSNLFVRICFFFLFVKRMFGEV